MFRWLALPLAVLLLGNVLGPVTASAAPPDARRDQAVIAKHVDGDTVDVRMGGQTRRIRLLNVDAPETKDPKKPVECLGPESTARLATILPIGSRVQLRYDRKRTDRYGRTLAAVYTQDGRLANEEIAKAGLGRAVTFDGNDTYYARVAAAQRDAAAQRLGMYSSDLACTVPARTRAVARDLSAATAAGSDITTATAVELEANAAAAAAAGAAALAIISQSEAHYSPFVWEAFSPFARTRMEAKMRQAQRRARLHQSIFTAAAVSASTREAEAARLAAEEARAGQEARRIAAEREEIRRAAAEASTRADQRQRARSSQPARNTASKPAQPVPKKSSPPPPASDPYAGYTGPRCYDPGGVTWKPCR